MGINKINKISMSINTKNIRANPIFVENFGVNNTMTNGAEWEDPTFSLIAETEVGAISPVSWALVGSSVASDFMDAILAGFDGGAKPDASAYPGWSDGYQVWATL